MKRIRLDDLLVARGLASSRTEAVARIMAGEIVLATDPNPKPGNIYPEDTFISVRDEKTFVSRGGIKLSGALQFLGMSVFGKICVDVGVSTGGFTDALLQAGAGKVYGVDVSYGDLAWKLRQDPRVSILERTNARYLEALPEPVALAVVDVSFISLKQILPKVRQWLLPDGEVLALIKPQFEVSEVVAGEAEGVITDRAAVKTVLADMVAWCVEQKFLVLGLFPASITGTHGNQEFFAYLGSGLVVDESSVEQESAEQLVSEAMALWLK